MSDSRRRLAPHSRTEPHNAPFRSTRPLRHALLAIEHGLRRLEVDRRRGVLVNELPAVIALPECHGQSTIQRAQIHAVRIT
jgi:hypothetical protein